MSSIVVFRNSPLGKQVLQESVNNSMNISNNDSKSVRREIIIVRKKKLDTPTTISVTSLLQASEPVNVVAKRLRTRDNSVDEVVRTPPSLSVARRNARERNRVRQVNDGFAALRKHIPDEVASAFESANCNKLGPNKKLSKVETLRMAVEYIRNLERLLNIGHADKENGARPSMDSFPSPASSSPRDNSQERSYFMNSPALEDDELDDDDLDSSMHQIPQQHFVELPSAETLLGSTPHLYEEDDGAGQPMTPSSDLLGHEEVNPHLLENHYVTFPNSAEQFSIIPEQGYLSESDVTINENDFEIKYADTIHEQIQVFNGNATIPMHALNTDLILSHDQYKFTEEETFENQEYSDVDLKKELPDIKVTPEDREQFEETLKWWQEKTKLVRPVSKINET